MPRPSDRLTVEVMIGLDGRPAVVRANGEIDITSSPWLESNVTPLLLSASVVVVDLSGVTFMDATGVGALARLGGLAERLGVAFGVRNPNDGVARTLRITGAAKLILEDSPVSAPTLLGTA